MLLANKTFQFSRILGDCKNIRIIAKQDVILLKVPAFISLTQTPITRSVHTSACTARAAICRRFLCTQINDKAYPNANDVIETEKSVDKKVKKGKTNVSKKEKVVDDIVKGTSAKSKQPAEVKKKATPKRNQPMKVDFPQGIYVIRCFVDDPDKLWFIHTPPENAPWASAMEITGKDFKQKVTGGEVPAEAFIQVINHRKNILLYQVETGRYAAVDFNLKSDEAARPTSGSDQTSPVISFFVAEDELDRVGKEAEFELIAPTGKKTDGVAIRSVGQNRYVQIAGTGSRFLELQGQKLSKIDLFAFERVRPKAITETDDPHKKDDSGEEDRSDDDPHIKKDDSGEEGRSDDEGNKEAGVQY